jgi:beta-lactam-binding protein with PASTA domain
MLASHFFYIYQPINVGNMKFLKFLTSRIFLKHLLIAVSIIVSLSIIALLFLRIYTRHGQALSVPDIIGLGIPEADSILAERELRYQIVDSVYNANLTRGSIIDQNPSPEFKVKKGRTIFLTINAFNPEFIRMPNVVGVSLRQATAILQTAGLTIGQLTYVPDIAVNNVLQQKYNADVIEEGDSIIRGSQIDLLLGRGLSNEKTAAPDLIGLLLEQAKERITNRYLNLGAVIYDASFEDAEDSLNAFVWKQKPEFNEEALMNLGSSVDIWLTADSTKLPLPDNEITSSEHDGDEGL